MAASLQPNPRTDAFFITRSLKCQAYGRCHCRVAKKPAFWINPGAVPTGHLPAMAFTSLYMTSVVAGVDPADSAVTTPPPGKSNIGFFEFATGKTILISSLDKPTMSTGLAVSPDGRSILFVQNEFCRF